jgi:adenylate cyclase, class 2
MLSGPKEIEIKLAVKDAVSAATLLRGRNFQVIKPRVFEVNLVFDTPDGTIRASGQVLRLRKAGECVLTFKGPPEQARHKTRQETEVVVSDFEAAVSILRQLGYQPVFQYEKYRTELARAGEAGLVTLDETPVGCFMELEGSPDWIDRTANELGFTESQYLTASYGSLYRKHCNSQGLEARNMVFLATPSESIG